MVIEDDILTEQVIDSTGVNNDIYRDYQFYKFVKMAVPNINIVNAILIRNIVTTEQPIHIERIVDLISTQYGFDQAVIRASVYKYILNPTYKKDGDFVYFDSRLLNKPRRNEYEKRLKFDHIYPGEIRAAIIDIVKNSFGLNQEDLMKSVITVFGHKNLVPRVKNILSEIIAELISNGTIIEVEGILSVKE